MVEVRSARLRRTRRRGLTIVEATVADSSGSIGATWFNQPWLADRLRPGVAMLLVGSLDRRGLRVSEHEFLGGEDDGEPPSGIHTTGLVPVHPATEGLRPQRIREWVWQALLRVGDVIEPLPAELRSRRGLAGATDSLRAVHFPACPGEAEEARRRIAFEELFLYQAVLAARRQGRRTERPGRRLGAPGPLVERWLASLPFEPTDDQRKAFAELDRDLDSGEPMQRLLMGEVGSGKTVVALYAMLRALEAGLQAALMAPTETLAEQHAATLDRLLGAEAVSFGLLTGSTPAPERRRCLGRLASGRARPGGWDARADRAGGRIRPARRLRGRRAAPLRGAAARRARREGAGRRGPAPPPHDGDADTEDAFADHLRRSRRHRSAPAPGWADAGRDLAGRRRAPRRGLRVHQGAPPGRAPGVRRLPSGLRVGEAAGEGGGRGGSPPRGRRAARLPDRGPARPDGGREEERGDGRLRRGRDRRSWWRPR